MYVGERVYISYIHRSFSTPFATSQEGEEHTRVLVPGLLQARAHVSVSVSVSVSVAMAV